MTPLLASIDWVAWFLMIARVVVIFAGLMLSLVLVIWFERKVVAHMQTRLGPLRAGPFGMLVTLADGIKLFFKEGITPSTADLPVYLAAPLASAIPALLAFAVIPFGPGVTLFGRHVPFQISDLSVGILWILAMASLAVYGVVLAGWASGSNYPLLGAIRSSAQMVSYEVGMSLGLIAVILYSGTLTMSGLVDAQARHFGVTGLGWLPKWNIIMQFPAFLIYAVAALAEANRPPFDLPEAETELVAGYHTEYSGIKFAMFYLAEYVHMITVAAVSVTLFLGGWRGPMFHLLPWLWPVLWFAIKLVSVLFVFVWIRATLPRFRYDRLMAFGWKMLIPIGLLWILITGALVALPAATGWAPWRVAVVVCSGTVALVLIVYPLFVEPAREPRDEPAREPAGAAGETLPEPAGRMRCRSVAGGVWRTGPGLLGDHAERLPQAGDRRVPEGGSDAPRALARRAAPPEPARERPGEVHRVRAVRVGLPGRRHLGGGGGQRPRAARLGRRAIREGLPDQLPALHHVRPVRGGLPDPGAHADVLVRDGVRDPRGGHLREGTPAEPAARRGRHTEDEDG